MRNPFRTFLERHGKANRLLFIAPILAVAVSLGLMGGGSSLIASALKDPLAIFSERSPGERQGGRLTDTKPIPLDRFGPSERVLALPRARPAQLGVPEQAFSDVPLELLPTIVLPDTGFAPDSPDGPDLFPTTPPTLELYDGPTGPGGPVLPGAVPEPATWLMSIIGMFTVAATIRRKHRAARNPVLSRFA